jgi:GT2 family glycosyltransferase
MNKVALVTVNFNGAKDTLELLATLKTIDFSGLEYNIVVVDKTPDSWIGDQIGQNFPHLDIIQAGCDKGFAGSYNYGMRYAAAWGADYIMIINNDTLVGDPQIVKKMIAVLDDKEDARVVSPKIYFAKGFEFQDRYAKKDLGKVLWYAGGNFDWANVRSVHRGIDEVDTGIYRQTEKTGFVSGCCLMVRRHTLEKFGYFNEDYFAYFEDNEWQQRILQGGGLLYYCGNTHIYHKVSQTMGLGSPQTDYLLTRNRLYFTFKYASLRTKFAVFRELLRQLISGREAQKQGIIGFIKGIHGPSPYTKNVAAVYNYPIRASVIVSDFKTSVLTSQFLKSIYRKDSGFDPKTDEVIVIDNATDDDFSIIEKNYPQARIIKNAINKGFVGAYNRLMEYARGELVLMFNSDIEIKDDAINTLIKVSRKYNHEAVLTGKLLFPDGGPQDSCFNLPTISGAFNQYFLKKEGSYFMFRPEDGKHTRVEGGCMADFLIPRKVINKIGYLNRKLFMYFEDIDYCRRLKKADIPIYYVPEAEFYHHHGATAKKIGKVEINRQLIESAKIYHGEFKFKLLSLVLRLGQKWGKMTTPTSRWEKETPNPNAKSL